MIFKKTCWYTTIFPIRAGAIIGSRDEADLVALLRFGFFLGAAFQIEDDLLNLVGDRARYGKEIDGDLREGKRTMMIIRLLECVTASEREQLRLFLGKARADKTDSEVRWLRGLLDQHRCLDYARQAAHGLAGAAMYEFSGAFDRLPDGRDKQFLAALPTWVLQRS